MNSRSYSSSTLLSALLFGPLTPGSVLSPAHLQFGDYVVCLTAPLAPRMPNGIESSARGHPKDRIVIGGGRVAIGTQILEMRRPWNPVPTVAAHLRSWTAGPEPAPLFTGRDPGLMPAEDELLSGYIAGLVLLHRQRSRALRLAEQAASGTTALGRTLLRHAARGEVPEPVHVLLATGDRRPLLAFDHSSGSSWLRGLVSAGYPLEVDLAVHGVAHAAGGGAT
jgi:hypothetical protein